MCPTHLAANGSSADCVPGGCRYDACLRMHAKVWLAPFDFGIMQQVDLLFCQALEEPGFLEIRVRLIRKAGEANAWGRINKAFFHELRKQLLVWRSLEPSSKRHYEDVAACRSHGNHPSGRCARACLMATTGPQPDCRRNPDGQGSAAAGKTDPLAGHLAGRCLGGAHLRLTPFNNVYRQATPLGGGHFPLAPFFILVWLTLLAAAARRLFRHRILLTGRELLVAWILMVLVSGIAYTGLARTFFINLTAPYQFATVENRWEEVLQPLLPERLVPPDGRSRPATSTTACPAGARWAGGRCCGKFPGRPGSFRC